MIRALCAAFLIVQAGQTRADDWPPLVQSTLQTIADECADYGNGVQSLGPDAVVQLIPAVGSEDPTIWVVDEAMVYCSSDASFRCGTGGCPIHFIGSQIVTEELARAWRVIEMSGVMVVILEVHVSRCQPRGHCFKAMTFWDQSGVAVSVEPPLE